MEVLVLLRISEISVRIRRSGLRDWRMRFRGCMERRGEEGRNWEKE
jgi:hypothetical protein